MWKLAYMSDWIVTWVGKYGVVRWVEKRAYSWTCMWVDD